MKVSRASLRLSEEHLFILMRALDGRELNADETIIKNLIRFKARNARLWLRERREKRERLS